MPFADALTFVIQKISSTEFSKLLFIESSLPFIDLSIHPQEIKKCREPADVKNYIKDGLQKKGMLRFARLIQVSGCDYER